LIVVLGWTSIITGDKLLELVVPLIVIDELPEVVPFYI
jgi:hypothetical protein